MITRIDQTGAQIYFSLTVQLPGGQITGAGLASAAPSKTIAITGGTGRYVDAAGQLDLVENGDDTGTLTLTLTS